jgi:N-acetylneuraminic acid mutarotase
VYLVGGYDGSVPRREIYATSDGVRFTRAAILPIGLRYAAAASAGTDVLIAGGVSSHGPVDSIYRFSPGTGTVKLIGHLPAVVGHAAAIDLGSYVYVAGGEDAAGQSVRAIIRIDPGTGVARKVGALPESESDAACATDSHEGWLIGGLRGSAVATVYHLSLAATSPP